MRKNRFWLSVFFSLLILFIIPLSNCEKKDEAKKDDDKTANDTINEIRDFTYELMQYWYFWQDKMPDINRTDYATAEEILEALRYTEKDRWSYITEKEEFQQYFEEGKYLGLGISLGWDHEDNLRLIFVFEDSPLREKGAKRGWKILEINGIPTSEISEWDNALGEDVAGEQVSFKFEDLNGKTVETTATKREITMNTVLHSEVLQLENKKAGYLVLKGFIGPTFDELDAAFNRFNQENINDFILDLRYNGGGRLDVAKYLCELICGTEIDRQILYKIVHNIQREENNVIDSAKVQSLSMSVDNLVVLTSQGTASASELVVNSLFPYINVVLVGDDTYGKPVGMYSWEYYDKMIVPVTFKILNADNQGDYFDGIQADAYRLDDLSMPFGDTEETCLKEAVYYLNHGEFSDIVTRKKKVSIRYPIKLEGFEAEIGAY